MTLSSTFRPAIRFGLKVLGALAFLAPLATRLVMGQAFFLTGRGKLENFPRTVEFFTGLGIPMPELEAIHRRRGAGGERGSRGARRLGRP
jgi:uncharacterized membrane protein YphA (DoxX/SURF4 family)